MISDSEYYALLYWSNTTSYQLYKFTVGFSTVSRTTFTYSETHTSKRAIIKGLNNIYFIGSTLVGARSHGFMMSFDLMQTCSSGSQPTAASVTLTSSNN